MSDCAPAAQFNETIHGAVRLRVCAMLHRLGTTEFRLLRDSLEVSDPTLSKHLRILEAAGYVDIIKGIIDSRPRTRVQLTESGRRAFRGHVAFLRTITEAITAEP